MAACGYTTEVERMNGKRLELLHELVPAAKVIAGLYEGKGKDLRCCCGVEVADNISHRYDHPRDWGRARPHRTRCRRSNSGDRIVRRPSQHASVRLAGISGRACRRG